MCSCISKRLPILLFFSQILILFTSFHGVCSAPKKVRIGLVLPLSSELGISTDSIIGIRVAHRHIIADRILPDDVELITEPENELFLDDQSRQLVGLHDSTILVLQRDVAVLIGAWNSAVSIQMANFAASVGMTQISGGSVSPLLSVKKNYP